MTDSQQNITDLLKRNYFWDIDLSSGMTAPKRLIIERVFNLGTLSDMNLVISYYGREEVIRTLLGLNYIDPKTLNFVSKFFNRPIKEFKCYIRKQLMPQCWNF
jgi:hypothetical protein